MGNELSSAIMVHDDVLILILEKLEIQDQLSMIKCDNGFEVILVKSVWSRGLTVDTDIIEDNNHFKQLMLKHGRTFRRLNVDGGIDNFNWNSLRSLSELTVVSLKNVNLNVHYLYNMVRTLVNIESLVLQSINFHYQMPAFYNHNPINYDFKVKSMKKLQVQFDTQLCRLIENCINLEELSIDNIFENDLIFLNNFLIAKDEINSKINGFTNAYKAFAYDITFGIHLKKGQPANVCVMHNSGINFETILQATERLNNLGQLMDAEQECWPFELVLLPEIDKQLRSFEIGKDYLMPVVNLDNFLYSKYIHIKNCCVSSQQFSVILQQLHLEKLKLERCNILDPTANTSNTYYGQTLKILEIDDNSYPTIVAFFETNPNCIKNVEIFQFCGLASVNRIIQFIANNLPNIKLLQFIRCVMNLLPDTLVELNRMTSLKQIEINYCFLYSHVLQGLLRCIDLKYLVVHITPNSIVRDVPLENQQNFSSTLEVISIGFSCFIRNKNIWHGFLQNNSGLQLHVHYNGMQTLKEITSNHQTMQHIKRIHFNEIIVCPEILRNLSVPVVRADFNTTNFTCQKMSPSGDWRSDAVIVQT